MVNKKAVFIKKILYLHQKSQAPVTSEQKRNTKIKEK